jgi:succinate dehydrogenase / fumarate reductase cytochrome b subunit
MRDLSRLVIEIFKQPGYVAWYLVALLFLCVHLKHGVGSTLQSLGLKNEQMQGWIGKASLIYALVVTAGFISQPLYVLFFTE